MNLKYLLLIFIAVHASLAQYTENDKGLVKTVDRRSFDAAVIDKYLSSDDPQKLRAVLLGVSHSNDTSYAEKILRFDFDRYGDYIAFALGQLGACGISENFLLEKLLDSNDVFREECFDALGRTGSERSLQKIIGSYNSDTTFNSSGISVCLANFSMRNFTPGDYGMEEVLLNELENTDKRSKFEALYALNRIGPSELSFPYLVSMLQADMSDTEFPFYSYTLGSLRKIKKFPDDFDLARKFISGDDWRIRCEASRSVCYYNFNNTEELDEYLLLLKDENINVRVQTALSLKDLNIKGGLRSELRSRIKEYFLDENEDRIVKGEAFFSYCTLFPNELFEAIEEFEDEISDEYLFRSIEAVDFRQSEKYDYLTSVSEDIHGNDFIYFSSALLSIQNKYFDDEDYVNLVLSLLNSDNPAVISIVAGGLEKPFMFHNSQLLQQIILDQIFTKLDDPVYLESLLSIHDLCTKMDKNFSSEVATILSKSAIPSLNKFFGENRPEYTHPAMGDSLFDSIWQDAFAFDGAVVSTTKGDFKILFQSSTAPISVGNFCMLSSKGYFNDVIFHRVVPNFVIQTGDTTGTGYGGPSYSIVSEFSPDPFVRGSVGMASAGKDTEGSQWFVMHDMYPHLNRRYTNFGRIVEGMDVVDRICKDDKIIAVQLIKKSE